MPVCSRGLGPDMSSEKVSTGRPLCTLLSFINIPPLVTRYAMDMLADRVTEPTHTKAPLARPFLVPIRDSDRIKFVVNTQSSQQTCTTPQVLHGRHTSSPSPAGFLAGLTQSGQCLLTCTYLSMPIKICSFSNQQQGNLGFPFQRLPGLRIQRPENHWWHTCPAEELTFSCSRMTGW